VVIEHLSSMLSSISQALIKQYSSISEALLNLYNIFMHFSNNFMLARLLAKNTQAFLKHFWKLFQIPFEAFSNHTRF
jgi:hypothetical protein